MIERISILLPCAAQKREYLEDALASVTNQTTSAWELLIGLDPAPPLWIRDLLVKHVDGERIRCVIAEKPTFAAVLNALMRSATTPFVAILLSDDRYTLDAVETLLRYRSRYPRADFFHSSRRYIDAGGAVQGGAVMESRRSFTLADFQREGSPVKHLMCWRRDAGLAVGGMNEDLSSHGCDDYDFPWRMAEAGASFRAVRECLY
jgi:glycosyltransferase involved in cell wall biosynthesis